MNAILLSITSPWCVRILNKEKQYEIRRKFPRDFVGWVYIYCTKEKPYIKKYHVNNKNTETVVFAESNTFDDNSCINGKVVARFWCNKVHIIKPNITDHTYWANNGTGMTFEDFVYSCDGKELHALPITKLQIFEKPKELKEFYTYKDKLIYSDIDCPPYVDKVKVQITKGPRNYQWIYIGE